MYCGSKEVPPGKTRGTPNACFKKGISVGFAASKSSNVKRVKTARVAGEAAATARSKATTKTRVKGALAAKEAAIEAPKRLATARYLNPREQGYSMAATNWTPKHRIKTASLAGETAATARARAKKVTRRPRLQPTDNEVPQDAFEREFAPKAPEPRKKNPVAAQAAAVARDRSRRPAGNADEARIKELADLPSAEFNDLAIRNGFVSKKNPKKSTLTSGTRMDKARKLFNKMNQ